MVLLLASIVHAEPRVRQFDPPQSVLLGHPVYWILEVRHPLWESYDVSLQAPAGAAMQIEDRLDRRDQNEMVSVYRIRITAQELTLPAPPAAIVTGSGGTAVITAKALTVSAISKDSMDLRDPALPRFPVQPTRTRYIVAGSAIAALLLSLLVLWLLRKRAATPRQVLLRRLQEALAKARRPADPAAMSRLFRSELLWGGAVEAATVSELQERGKQHPQLAVLSEALEKYEMARYSGAPLRDPDLVKRSVQAALDVLGRR